MANVTGLNLKIGDVISTGIPANHGGSDYCSFVVTGVVCPYGFSHPMADVKVHLRLVRVANITYIPEVMACGDETVVTNPVWQEGGMFQVLGNIRALPGLVGEVLP